jgi:hypothetical protein
MYLECLKSSKMVTVGHDGLFRKHQRGAPGQKYRQGDLQFHPRQRCAEAVMNPSAEAHMSPPIPAIQAIRVENVWVREDAGVVVRSPKKKPNTVPDPKRHTSIKLDRFESIAGKKVKRRIKAQDFLD